MNCRFIVVLVVASASLATVPLLAVEPESRWVSTATLAAPEAVQAAAADERFAYAITNDRVAKYERRTGKRLAVSEGEARHLNSGFLHDGRLYCVHSNYPQTPERSEIKVLDLETMHLATFKDFGSYSGSLTWAVLRDGQWWCNFARYGKENNQTFLVQFATDWKEQARWTYPPEVIRQLGSYSLSGGIWRGDHLLVTGHDDEVIFQLGLPEQGNVLRLISKQAAPFTGQGFAHDPATNGLVGIHRGNKLVVFAARSPPEPLRLRVLTYNIHHGEGVDGKLDLERIASVIVDAKPDLVALQEVDQKVGRTQSVDQPPELARLTKMHVAFGGNLALQGGKYGNAVLSRFPIAGQANHPLPNSSLGEPRGVLTTEISLPGISTPLRFCATHLDHRPKDAERLASAIAINKLAEEQASAPSLLAGDLNDGPESPTLTEFAKGWTRSSDKALPTIPVAQPDRQIDFVLFRPQTRWKVIDNQVLPEAIASDHRALLTVLELAQPLPDK